MNKETFIRNFIISYLANNYSERLPSKIKEAYEYAELAWSNIIALEKEGTVEKYFSI